MEEIAHLPGYRAPQPIDKADAAEAARRGIVVVTTAGLINRWKEREPERYAAVRNAQIANLRVLKEARVKLAVGSIALRVKDGRILELGPRPPAPPED